LVCRETIKELIVALQYPKFKLSGAEQQAILNGYLVVAESVMLPSPLAVLASACRDPKDEIFIHLALGANADFLVSGDNDLLSMRGQAPVPIISLQELRALQ